LLAVDQVAVAVIQVEEQVEVGALVDFAQVLVMQ
jgi:hypothetical protein